MQLITYRLTGYTAQIDICCQLVGPPIDDLVRHFLVPGLDLQPTFRSSSTTTNGTSSCRWSLSNSARNLQYSSTYDSSDLTDAPTIWIIEVADSVKAVDLKSSIQPEQTIHQLHPDYLPSYQGRHFIVDVPGHFQALLWREDDFEAQGKAITNRVVPGAAKELIFIHSAAVLYKEQAIILPGRSYSGKSTFTQALLQAGCKYLSDEYSPLQADGMVVSYPVPISLRAGAPETLKSIVNSHTERGRSVLQNQEPTNSYPVGIICVAKFDEACKGLEVEPCTASQATLDLLSNSSELGRRPKQALSHAASATLGAICLTGRRGNAEDAAKRLIKLLETSQLTKSRFLALALRLFYGCAFQRRLHRRFRQKYAANRDLHRSP